MLIYKAMNVFPSAIRDVVLNHFESQVTGYLQVVKDHAAQTRFDSPIPVDIEIKPAVTNPAKLKKEIEDKIRDVLTVRVAANLVPPETIERTVYKTPLVRVQK
jgi:phenylacetate-CoA ligase/benzoylacetate-CoA ligase